MMLFELPMHKLSLRINQRVLISTEQIKWIKTLNQSEVSHEDTI